MEKFNKDSSLTSGSCFKQVWMEIVVDTIEANEYQDASDYFDVNWPNASWMSASNHNEYYVLDCSDGKAYYVIINGEFEIES